MIDATFGFGKAEAPSAAASRDNSLANVAPGTSSFSATLAAQDAAEPNPDQSSEQSTVAPGEPGVSKEVKPKQAKASEADSADDGSEADKAAAAAATLAQMLAGAVPAPLPLAAVLTSESSAPMAADDAAAGKSQPANTLANATQTVITAVATQAGGPMGAGQGGFAAFASLIAASDKPETSIPAASAEGDALTPAAEAKSPAPTTPGLPGLSPFANPLRASALATALDAGQPAGLQATVGTHEWAEELGTRLAVMTAQGDQSGSLRLSPEHLGPLEVQIRMQDDKANVVFGAQHADTRRALEEALPRLREMFAASGLQLGEAGVSREPPRQAQAGWSPRSSGGIASIDAEPMTSAALETQRRYHLGLLDTVA